MNSMSLSHSFFPQVQFHPISVSGSLPAESNLLAKIFHNFRRDRAIPCKPTVSLRKVFRVEITDWIECNLSSRSLGVNRQKGVLIWKHIQVSQFLDSFIWNWCTMLSLLKFSFSRHLVNTNCLVFTNQDLLVTFSVSMGQELIRPLFQLIFLPENSITRRLLSSALMLTKK